MCDLNPNKKRKKQVAQPKKVVPAKDPVKPAIAKPSGTMPQVVTK